MAPLASALAIPTSSTSSPTRQRKRTAPTRRPRAPTRCGTADVSEASSSGPTNRSVVVMCHGVTPHARAGLFSAANLLQGRVDVWCRCVTAGLYLSDDVRRDTVVHLVMQSDDLASCRLVSVDGARVEGLAPAEKNVALLLQRFDFAFEVEPSHLVRVRVRGRGWGWGRGRARVRVWVAAPSRP